MLLFRRPSKCSIFCVGSGEICGRPGHNGFHSTGHNELEKVIALLSWHYGTLRDRFILQRVSLMRPKATAIRWEERESHLHATPSLGQDIRASLRSEEWNQLESWNAQVAFLLEFAAPDCGIELPSPTLAEVFDLMLSRVRTICIKTKRTQKLAIVRSPFRPIKTKRCAKWFGTECALETM
jgi:hypothetical protein